MARFALGGSFEWLAGAILAYAKAFDLAFAVMLATGRKLIGASAVCVDDLSRGLCWFFIVINDVWRTGNAQRKTGTKQNN